jgi:hypothetical protein
VGLVIAAAAGTLVVLVLGIAMGAALLVDGGSPAAPGSPGATRRK